MAIGDWQLFETRFNDGSVVHCVHVILCVYYRLLGAIENIWHQMGVRVPNQHP